MVELQSLQGSLLVSFANLSVEWIDHTDHMLHHDQPAEVARIIEAAFFREGAQ